MSMRYYPCFVAYIDEKHTVQKFAAFQQMERIWREGGAHNCTAADVERGTNVMLFIRAFRSALARNDNTCGRNRNGIIALLSCGGNT